MRAVLALLLLYPMLFAAPVPKDRKKQEQSILGSWTLTGESYPNRGGQVAAGRTYPTWVFTDDGSMFITQPGRSGTSSPFTYKTDMSQSPALFDFEFSPRGPGVATFTGIYKIEGDTLTICYSWANSARPEDFDGKNAGQSCVVYTFKRAEK